nr:hypothetical protein [Gilliamella apicola]
MFKLLPTSMLTVLPFNWSPMMLVSLPVLMVSLFFASITLSVQALPSAFSRSRLKLALPLKRKLEDNYNQFCKNNSGVYTVSFWFFVWLDLVLGYC